MNWIDGLFIVLLLSSVIVGSKKGLIRESMAFLVFFAAIIFSINFADIFVVWIYDKIGSSPLVCALISFVALLALSYAAFKLLGLAFYKFANLKEVKKRDQMGGALIGFVRGWIAVAFLTMLTFMLPLPDAFYTSFDKSFFGPAMAKTIPIIFETTAPVHPRRTNFFEQMEQTLLHAPSRGQAGKNMLDTERQQVHEALRRIEYHFTDNVPRT